MIAFDVIVDEPCKGGTPAWPRAQALGSLFDTFIEPLTGAALPRRKTNARVIVPLLIGAHFICSLCVPRVLFVPMARLPPWALQECRAYGTRN